MKPTGFRVAAFAIAVVAVLDPSVKSDRRARPLVAIASSPQDRVLADRVVDALERRFTVLRRPTEAASATVLVGGTLPDESSALLRGPVFGVVPVPSGPAVRIRSLAVPQTAPHDARIPVKVSVDVNGARGRDVRVDLWTGNTLIKALNGRALTDSGSVVVSSTIVLDAGAQLLRATARMDDLPPSDTVHTLVDVRADRLPVLFFDARPSWNSTFLRRALERDARFSVAHHVQTSRGLANTGGNAPVSLSELESLRAFAVIVIGAPDALTDSDLSGLDSFMRRRGGRVVLLMETRPSSTIERLIGTSGWSEAQTAAPTVIRDANGREALRAREIVWPMAVPSGALVHATSLARDSTRRTIIWSVSVGAGRVIVSGAADAWHYRDNPVGFDAFWVSLLAANALQAPAPIDVQLSPPVLAPGTRATVRVTIRDAFLSDRDSRGVRVSAMMVSDEDSTRVRLWPEHVPGQFSGTIVAAAKPGSRLLIVSGMDSAEVPLVIDSTAVRPPETEPQLIRAFVSSRAGAILEARDLNRLPDLIASAIQPVSRVETWHPMRSAWWIVPFALLLGAEWWWRRRRGMA